MKQFQNFEEENIHYWTGRTDQQCFHPDVPG